MSAHEFPDLAVEILLFRRAGEAAVRGRFEDVQVSGDAGGA